MRVSDIQPHGFATLPIPRFYGVLKTPSSKWQSEKRRNWEFPDMTDWKLPPALQTRRRDSSVSLPSDGLQSTSMVVSQSLKRIVPRFVILSSTVRVADANSDQIGICRDTGVRPAVCSARIAWKSDFN
jgi:hypothetical protein